jgi:single-strand DNA-binding protein
MVRNLFICIGNAGNDASVRKVGEKDVASVRLAVSNGKDKDGKDKDPTWFTVEGWGRVAERIGTVKKSDKLAIQGRIAVETYTDKEGVEKTTVKIIADDITYLSPKQGQGADDESDPF